MTMSQHEAREKFLVENINHGAELMMTALADANEALDDAIEFEDAMIPWHRKAGDPEAAVALTHLRKAHGEAMQKHANHMSWASTLSIGIGEQMLRLALGRDDLC